ncbi:transmission-blocking target antigen s230 paralog, putative [Plasmodium gallinaceum]|uniref:Transmission-blocking target antigen s230 paralog, putative n=1 Tax=Plasmodium gallinaceum TaxID=5849 RepID=A0A1J1GT09_PLAGA|nr:transmission-blocking target antigen s230 paralog, putative [Plasmodium gallinaceum]CRG95392.1 transmission-blocking target antigen s230 paralog, putative [Plasmodium gallinaceum]
MHKKIIIYYFYIYGIFILIFLNYDDIINLLKKNIFYNYNNEVNGFKSFSNNENYNNNNIIKNSNNNKSYEYILYLSSYIYKYMYDIYSHVFNNLKKKKNNDYYHNTEVLSEKKFYLTNSLYINNTRKLSVTEENEDLKPYVKSGERNETVVNLHEYFTGNNKRKKNNNEIVIDTSEKFHRVVIICFKPSLTYSHIITRPNDAFHHFLEESNQISSSEEIYPIPFFQDEGNWGLKNILSKGVIDFMIPSYSLQLVDIMITCSNNEIDETYTFEDLIKVRIRIPRSTRKILGVSTDEKDKDIFERIVHEDINDYTFRSYHNRILGLKLEDADLDPFDCFKTVYEEEKRVHLEVAFQFIKCLNMDRGNIKLRFFFLLEEFSDDEIQFSCSFTYKKKKKKVTFGKGEVTTFKEMHFLEDDKPEYLYYNDAPYKICNFEYKAGYNVQVCERTISEFTLFVYNCEMIKGTKILGTEPVSSIRYLNETYKIDKFSDITLFTKDIDILDIEKKFPKYKFFMTSYIDHGPYPLIIECNIPYGRDKFQKANILLHLRTNLQKKSVFFCDFTKSRNYSFLNSYSSGDTCNITVSSNSRFGFKCPEGTVKKPDKCFSEVYQSDKIYKLKDKSARNLVIYSIKQENLAVAAFHNHISKSFEFECHCVNKSNQDTIVKKVLVKYVNHDELYDYNIYDKVPHESLIKNPEKTHLCDFVNDKSVLEPKTRTPKNYVCVIHPKPLEYVALNCPISLVDEENEKKISELSTMDEEGAEDINIYLKKRNIYSNLTHLPKNAPLHVIDKSALDVVDINEIIPGVLVKDIINIMITDVGENGDISASHGVETIQLGSNKLYDKYIGLENNIENGFFIFQLPPYLKRNQTIEFACINDKTRKGGNLGNNGIMTVYIRSAGSIIDGCYFYKNNPENTYLKKNIKVGSAEDCNIKSDGELEYIGIACPAENNLFLTPPECFLETYDKSDVPIRITEYDKGFKHFSNDKGISYLKIPQSFLGYINLFCYCNTEEGEDGIIKKENKINIELNVSNVGVSEIKMIDHIFESDFLIGNEFVDRKPIDIVRKKHICDFTKKESSLDPYNELLIIHSCFLEIEDNLNLIEIICPRNVKSPKKAGGRATREDLLGHSEDLDQDDEDHIKKYKNMKYYPNNFDDELLNYNKKVKIEDVLPGIIILDKNRPFGEKGHFTFVSPLIVENDVTLKLNCDNSETVIGNKKGRKGTIVVKIPKNTTDKKFYGCDFSGNSKKTFYYSSVYDLKIKSETCEINLKENIIVSLNCPQGQINPTNCFKDVYIKSNMGEELQEKIENIFNDVKIINAHDLTNSSPTFLIISKITKQELNFYCTCEHYESKNIGTLYVKNKENLIFSKEYDNKKTVFIEVSPYYAKDTYVCDFTEQNYFISLNKEVDITDILKKYLSFLLIYKHDEFRHFSLNLKLRKEAMKKQYINYLKKKIEELDESPYDESQYTDNIIIYRCNIDLSAFDKFIVKCPSKNVDDPQNNFQNIIYSSNLGLNENTMLKGLNNTLYGTLLINKNQNTSFFEKGELELIISPYADSSKSINFSCENVQKDGTGKIGSASVFIKKNDNKILGCDFIDMSYEADSDSSHINGESRRNKKNSFEFEIELVEGKNVYCNIEAIENDIVGFSCPHNFVTSPQNCFETVQKEGLDKELEIHKLEQLVKGVKILNNEIYKYNFTPSYIILPKRIKKSLKIFCTCNSIKQIKTGIIQLNIIGDDLNNWFKKEITHNIYAFEKMEYFYDFSSGPLNISSENVLSVLPELLESYDSLSVNKDQYEETEVEKRQNLRKSEKAKFPPYNLLNYKGTMSGHNSLSHEVPVDTHDKDPKYKLSDDEFVKIEDEEDVEEENVLNPLRTKQVFEISVAASEFSQIKIICPLRNSLHYRQSKISPENFFEYVYVSENQLNKRKKKGVNDDSLITEIVEDSAETDDEENRIREAMKEKEETKVTYDDFGNKVIISIKSEKPKATVEDIDKLNEDEEISNTKKEVLVMKNINEVISFVTYKREISDKKYVGTLYVSPLLLNEANFFILCDNSLTLNESKRGKTGIVKINIKPNFLKMHGCDFVGDYSTHFYFSSKWEKLSNNYVCEIKVEDDALIGLACPSHTKMHPSDCFENVIKDDEVFKKDVLIESKNTFLFKSNGKPILSFIHIKRVISNYFICKCYSNENGGYKELSMKILYEPYVMGTPKVNLEKPIIEYKDIDLNLMNE